MKTNKDKIKDIWFKLKLIIAISYSSINKKIHNVYSYFLNVEYNKIPEKAYNSTILFIPRLIGNTKKIIIINSKNLKRLLNTKLSAFLILLGPLVLIILLGLAFQTSGFAGIHVGLYVEEEGDLSDDLKNILKINNFNLEEVSEREECIESVSRGDNHICIDIEGMEDISLTFHVDESRINIADSLTNILSEEVSDIADDMSLEVAREVLNVISETRNMIEENRGEIEDILSNIQEMDDSLRELGESILEEDIAEDAELVEQLIDPDSHISQSISQSRDNIDNMKSNVDIIVEELSPMSDDLDMISEEISEAYEEFECELQEDLSSELLEGNFADVLTESEDPLCNLLYTFQSNIDSRKENIETIIAEVEVASDELESIDGEIESVHNTAVNYAEGIDEGLEEVEEVRVGLSNNLLELANQTSEGREKINDMKDMLERVEDNFEDITEADAERIASPVTTDISPVDSEERENLDFLFPSIIATILMFISVLISTVLVMREKSSGAYFRNLILPVRNYLFIFGSYFTSLIITFAQIAVLLIVGLLAFNLNLNFSFGFFVLLFLSILVFSSIGLIIGNIAKSEEGGILSSIIICIILLVFSNILMPLETMAEAISRIASYTPFNLLEELLRRELVFGEGWSIYGRDGFLYFFLQLLLFIGLVFATYAYSVKKNN